MKARPLPIKLLTVSLALTPLVGGLLVAIGLYRFHHISPAVWIDLGLLTFGCVTAGVGIWKVRPWGFYFLILLGLLVLWADVQQVLANPKTLNLWNFIDVLYVSLGVVLLVQKQVRTAYFDPKVRWWERALRYDTEIRGQALTQDIKHDLVISNISTSGCFVQNQIDAREGDLLDIDFQHNNIRVSGKSKVVRKSENPKGLGLMFVNLPRATRRNLRRVVREVAALPA